MLVLSVGRLDGRVIACFADDHALILYVYVPHHDDPQADDSVVTYYVSSYRMRRARYFLCLPPSRNPLPSLDIDWLAALHLCTTTIPAIRGLPRPTPTAYPLFGQGETLLPWSRFVSEMNKFAIGDTPHWCRVCGVSTGMCASAATGSGSSDAGSAVQAPNSSPISVPVAGVIGALVTLAVVLGAQALIYVLSGMALVKKSTLAAQASAAAAGGKA
ncbi:hypothetical protein NUW58_g9173 [Xylaria curta]|uniref:Uncharacterized protein n=1 Tax=Xylaria curta TaxID=42375 RepID=A0ACC1N0X9_9PEZI|nr:hypothetical protein NUW58_g9173 [Xylaria curta]